MNKYKYDLVENDTEMQNIKSILRTNIFLKRLFHSFYSIYKVFTSLLDELLYLDNELNFRSVDPQLIESYNKMILFMYNQINSILSYTITNGKCMDTLIIKPVNETKKQFCQKLEFMYFIKNSVCITKSLGNISNVNITKINDQIFLYRSSDMFLFITIDVSTKLSVEQFREHLNNYIIETKKIIGWFYNDIDYVKLSFRSLLDVIYDAITLSENSKQIKKWTKLLNKIKTNALNISNCMCEIEK